MHKVRTSARKLAWHFREGDPPSTRYSSFRSKDSPAKPLDLESAAGNNGESTNLPVTKEHDFATNDRQDGHSATNTHALGGSESEVLSNDSPISPADNRSDSEKGLTVDRYNSMSQSDGTRGQAGRPRKRDRLAGIFGRRKEDDGSDLARTTTTESKSKKHFTIWGQVKVVIFGSWVNVLLVCVPLGIALKVANVSPYAVFAVNFMAIIPLAGILSYATEEIALRVGETLGGLLNASFGNAVELIVSIIALTKGQIIIVQTSLIGSILSNLLLVLGMCFFFGGLNRIEQFFNVTVAQTAASLLALAVGSLIIPTCFHRFGTGGTAEQREEQIPKLSRGVAVILLLVYLAYLYFQLKTHSTMFNATGQAATKRKPSKSDAGSVKGAIGIIGAGTAGHAGGPVGPSMFNPNGHQEKNDDEEEAPQLSIYGAIITLCAATTLVGVNSEFMVDGIGPVAAYISPEFIGLILIPIVGNAAEHATAVTVALKDKMDLAIGVAVGSSMQIALFVLPLVVVIGWIIGNPNMTLEFDGFLLTIVFVAVLLVNYLIGDGKSHWMEGVMLMMLYVIIAVAAYLYPASEDVVG